MNVDVLFSVRMTGNRASMRLHEKYRFVCWTRKMKDFLRAKNAAVYGTVSDTEEF